MPNERCLKVLPSAFPPLSSFELRQEWGQELYLGLQFAQELDLYRAITCYKRALFLAQKIQSETCSSKKINVDALVSLANNGSASVEQGPATCSPERINQIEYHLIEAYYFGRKFQSVTEVYESSNLDQLPITFPALDELLLMLEDAYNQIGCTEKSLQIHTLLLSRNTSKAESMDILDAVEAADFCALEQLRCNSPELGGFLDGYYASTKSVKKAQMLNAFLPGAGYYYVDQKKTAVTAFIVNALFTWAAYNFFHNGNLAAGLITTSLEFGWYMGGINGAGLAASEWNEKTYEVQGKDYLIQNRIFPVLMFNYAF